MNIGQRQLIQAINDIIRDEFQRGQVPTLRRLMQRINQQFQGKSIGQPLFTIRPAPYRQASSSADWNRMVEELETDLGMLFAQHLHQSDLLMRRYSQLETRLARINERISKANDRLLDLLMLLENTDGYFATYGDHFRSLEGLDMRPGQTTAWVDLSAGEVMPPISRGANRKLYLGDAETTVTVVEPEGAKYQPLSPIELALDDDTDTAWLGQVTTTEAGTVELRVTLRFDAERASRIIIAPKEPQLSSITVRITADGYNWFALSTRISAPHMVFDFAPQPVAGIQVVFRRDVFDSSSEEGYHYSFGLSNISLQTVGWEESGQLITQPIPVRNLAGNPAPLNRVSLRVEDERPPGSSIDYFVAIDEPDLVWHPIAPQGRQIEGVPNVVALGQVTPVGPIGNIPGSAPTLYRTEGGIDFYALHAINLQGQQYVPNSTKLVKGVGQWRRETFFASYSDSPHHIPSLRDWTNAGVLKEDMLVRYQTVRANLSLPAGSHLNARFITHLHAEEETFIQLRLSFTSTDGVSAARVYVNNRSQASGISQSPGPWTLQVPIGLDAGWNSIQVLIYREGSQESTISLPHQLLTQRGLRAVADPEPMREVSPFDLYNNVPYRDDTCYAVETSESSPLIIVNEYTEAQRAQYELSYRRTASQPTGAAIRLKAVLTSPGVEGPPPKLKGYTLFFGH